MRWLPYIPALALTTGVTLVLLWTQLMPFGEDFLLVRLGSSRPEAALTAAAVADSTLVAIPAPGFAVLHGDAARIRDAAGLAVRWRGVAGCSAAVP